MQKLTLRRAAQLQTEITNYTAKLCAGRTVVVRVSSVIAPLAFKNNSIAEFEEQVNTRLQLTAILYNIRGLVAATNAKTGVGEIMSQMAGIKQKIQILSEVIDGERQSRRSGTSAGLAPDDDAWQANFDLVLSKFKTSTDHYASDALELPVLTEQFRNTLQSQLIDCRRSFNNLSDQLLAINTNTTIDIVDEDWTTLQTLGLV